MTLTDLFNPHTPNAAGMFARLFCAALAVQVLLNFGQQYRFYMSQPAKLYGNGHKLLGLISLPVLSRNQFLAAGGCLVICLLLVASGIYPRPAVFMALICCVLYFAQIMPLAYIQRKANLIPIVLLILLVSSSLNKPLSSTSTRWELTLVKLALAQIYFSAGLEKMRRSGFKWLNGAYLQAHLLENYLWTDRPAALAVASNLIVCAALSTFVLIFELTFAIVVFFPMLAFFYVGFALIFHVGTLITMRINYLKYLWPVYLVFFTNIAFHFKTILGL